MSSSDHSIEAKPGSSDFGKTTAGQGSTAYSMNLIEEDGSLSKETARLYKSFMQSYVTRINDATFRVPIAGIRIGSAKYSRLAQINLKTRIITFSRFAIENVPERGRRYLVLHELAHVLEASHNKTFWHLVGQFEPEYKDIGVSLDRAFKQNVESHEKTLRSLKRKARSNGGSPAQNQQQLKLYNSHGGQTPQSIIWTPNHGYVEPGSQRFGLHRDPKELFFKAGESQAEETYAAYLDLDLEEEAEQEPTQTSCIFDASSEVDKAQDLYVYEDEGDFDLFYGTMSGGDY